MDGRLRHFRHLRQTGLNQFGLSLPLGIVLWRFGLQPADEGLARVQNQLLDLRRCGPDDDGGRDVGRELLIPDAHVEAHDIPALQEPLRFREAVHDFLVD